MTFLRYSKGLNFRISKTKMKQKFQFLCGYFEQIRFVYAIKDSEHPWHYFDESESLLSKHISLPEGLRHQIGLLNGIKTLQVLLDDTQTSNYFVNGKFLFNGKPLGTCKSL